MAARKPKTRGDDNFIPQKLKPLTDGQADYINAIETSLITLCAGKPGTGKTWVAVGSAVKALQNRHVDKIIFTRPAVECGEKLGFMPGTERDKFLVYMMPLLNVLEEFMSKKEIEYNEQNGIIELAPLAFMRGCSFHKSFVILDEAENCTMGQLKMFVSRLGRDSRLVINGDTEQSDLTDKKNNPFALCMKKFKNLDEKISCVELTNADIVRHPLISLMMEALET